MEFLNDLMDYIDNNIDMGEGITIKMPLLDEKDSVAIRLLPSEPIDYIVGSTFNKSFQILTKYTNQLKAIQVLEDITTAIHRKTNVINGDSYKVISMECSTLPNWVETTDDGYYIYTALFNAELEYLGG